MKTMKAFDASSDDASVRARAAEPADQSVWGKFMNQHVSRRGLVTIGAAVAAVTTPALAMEGLCTSLEADPLIKAARNFSDAHDDYNAQDFATDDDADAYADAHLHPPIDVIKNWKMPAKSLDGALGALRVAQYEVSTFAAPPTVLPMIEAVLSWLEGQSSASDFARLPSAD